MKHWGVSNDIARSRVADSLCDGEEMIIWESFSNSKREHWILFAVLAFYRRKANMQEGPTAFQRDDKNRRGGRLFWGIQGNFWARKITVGTPLPTLRVFRTTLGERP